VTVMGTVRLELGPGERSVAFGDRGVLRTLKSYRVAFLETRTRACLE